MEKGVKFSSKIFRKHGKKFLKVFRVELRRDLSIAHKVSVIKTVGTCQELSMSHEGMNAESVADEETMSNWDNDCLPLETCSDLKDTSIADKTPIVQGKLSLPGDSSMSENGVEEMNVPGSISDFEFDAYSVSDSSISPMCPKSSFLEGEDRFTSEDESSDESSDVAVEETNSGKYPIEPVSENPFDKKLDNNPFGNKSPSSSKPAKCEIHNDTQETKKKEFFC
uniref:Uncharacterized protein n=1 Tax=Clytia hemisphaerica TaxID=252671 RepID=A0A7M5VEZ6_9CNID